MAARRRTDTEKRRALELVAQWGSVSEAARRTGIPRPTLQHAYEDAKAAGIADEGPPSEWEQYAVEERPHHSWVADGDLEFRSGKDNTFTFGCVSDNHLCSKYERLDVLNDLYDRFKRAGITRVYNAGNWIDGEAGFNRFDISVTGLEPQLRYLARHYPKRKGITTYAVAGEDHEGWYGRREAVDIGRLAERIMHDSGRMDWRHIGFMECFVPLVNANSGKTAMMLVMHPGGGSAYATSYRPQKIVESFEGGEKPAVLLLGHYHKLSVNLVRNVWALQIGCTQDQTVFMRKKNIDAHIGGMKVRLEQDPDTGAITACETQIIRYFNKGYKNNRWSVSDNAELPERETYV